MTSPRPPKKIETSWILYGQDYSKTLKKNYSISMIIDAKIFSKIMNVAMYKRF
jgi:hypothetical protein